MLNLIKITHSQNKIKSPLALVLCCFSVSGPAGSPAEKLYTNLNIAAAFDPDITNVAGKNAKDYIKWGPQFSCHRAVYEDGSGSEYFCGTYVYLDGDISFFK